MWERQNSFTLTLISIIFLIELVNGIFFPTGHQYAVKVNSQIHESEQAFDTCAQARSVGAN